MREILEYIDESKGSITPMMISGKLGIKEKEVEKVFLWLIENDKVIDLSDKQGMGIAKKRGVDYLSFLTKEERETKTATKIATKIGAFISSAIAKIIIGVIIGILILVIWAVYGEQMLAYVRGI